MTIILSLLITNTICHSQGITKLLSEKERNKLEISDTIHKYVDTKNSYSYDGFTGTLIIKRINHAYKSTQIGIWVRNNSKYGLNAISVSDSIGKLLYYKEFNKNNAVAFYCNYKYLTRNNKNYRIEMMQINDEKGNIEISGFRYWQMKMDKFGFYFLSQKHQFGVWKYYNEDGSLKKTKNYGDIK